TPHEGVWIETNHFIKKIGGRKHPSSKAGKSFAENGKMRIFAAPKKKSDDFWCNGVLPERV
ncbi:MAG: hypothetical protein MR690_01250, partial [Rikenellaceae bacterium]|nr:hypothetical protein [Rikenellaceae bacterium]